MHMNLLKSDLAPEELYLFRDKQRSALEGRCEMTYDLFWECLQVCFDHGDMDMYQRTWKNYPTLAAKAYQGDAGT